MKHSLFKIKVLSAGFVALATLAGAAHAATYDLVIDEKTVNLTGRDRTAMTIGLLALRGRNARWSYPNCLFDHDLRRRAHCN